MSRGRGKYASTTSPKSSAMRQPNPKFAACCLIYAPMLACVFALVGCSKSHAVDTSRGSRPRGSDTGASDLGPSNDSGSACAPQDVTIDPSVDCLGVPSRYHWNGEVCVEQNGCLELCTGEDCASRFSDLSACQTAYRACGTGCKPTPPTCTHPAKPYSGSLEACIAQLNPALCEESGGSCGPTVICASPPNACAALMGQYLIRLDSENSDTFCQSLPSAGVCGATQNGIEITGTCVSVDRSGSCSLRDDCTCDVRGVGEGGQMDWNTRRLTLRFSGSTCNYTLQKTS